jgi:hypothetical protein
MRHLHALSLSLVPVSLCLALTASGEPPVRQCAFEVRLSERTLSATSSQGCPWARLSAVCSADRPCSFHVTSRGLGEPESNGLQGIIVRPDPDGLHARYECQTGTGTCTVSFAAGEGHVEVKVLTSQQSTLGLTEARVSIPLPPAK